MMRAGRCLALFGVFPPYGGAGAVRAVKLIKYLGRCGWDVDVVAPRGRAGWFKDEELAAELGNTRVVRVGLPNWAPAAVERLRAAGKDVRQGAS
ncbi:MAG: hypothetical protein HYZ27_06585, partial [Deltaproteobacteria bacterium]|nr:hypothetical protein [Deltaproteobacteria bacterium]